MILAGNFFMPGSKKMTTFHRWKYLESAGFFAGVRIGELIFRYQFEAPLGTAVLTRFTTNQVMVGYLL